MQSAVKDKAYKSPVRKLARFFEKSRDQWKAKHHQAKANVKCDQRSGGVSSGIACYRPHVMTNNEENKTTFSSEDYNNSGFQGA